MLLYYHDLQEYFNLIVACLYSLYIQQSFSNPLLEKKMTDNHSV